MKVIWVNPCFLDYRVPVYQALSKLLGNTLTVIFSRNRTPDSVCGKIRDVLGDRAVGLGGELRLSFGASTTSFANVGLNIPFQPGLLRAIDRAKPDVIISEGFFQWTPASLLYKTLNQTALAIAYERTVHTERNAGVRRTAYRRFVAQRADAFVCNGVLSKQYCTEQLRVPESRVVTGAMAADSDGLGRKRATISERERRRHAERLGLTGPVFVCVGRLIRLKGLRELLGAWAQYVDQQANPGTLLLVGDGPERNVLEDMVRELGLSNVVFSGAVAYEEIAGYFAVGDVLVVPTLEDNWSLVVPEAMACGLPVLCSRYNGCWPELIQPERNGWVFDPCSREDFAALLAAVHRDRERLPEMGRASEIIVKNFSPEHAARAVLNACEIALMNRPVHRRAMPAHGDRKGPPQLTSGAAGKHSNSSLDAHGRVA